MPIPTQRRRWPRRLYQTAAALFLALVTVVLVAAAINHFDERIEASTQAWLDYPAPAAPAAQNGYLALLALDAQAADPLAAASAVVREEQAFFTEARKSRQPTQPRYDAIRARLLQSRAPRIYLDNCKDRCHGYILGHAEKLAELSVTHAGLLGRYAAMLDFPAYAEEIPRDPRALYPNYDLADKLGLLYLANAVALLQKGDAPAAYQAWGRYQRFWQGAAAGSATLIGTMRAVAQLERSQSILAAMIEAQPQAMGAARQYALPLLAGRAALAPQVARSMVGEFQMQAYVVTDMIYQASLFATGDMQAADLRDRLALLFYQRNASLNLLQRLHQTDLARNGVTAAANIPLSGVDTTAKAPCARSTDWRLLANPVGKMFLCQEDSYDLHRYHERAAKTDAAANALQRILQTTH